MYTRKKGCSKMIEKIIIVVFLASTTLYSSVVADYRMDECYWLDNAGGIIGDVKESNNSLNGTSYGTAQTYLGTALNTAPICMASDFNATGDFVDVPNNVLLTTTNTFSISAWIRPKTFASTYELLVSKTSNFVDGFSFYTYWNGATGFIVFLIGNGATSQLSYAVINANVWSHVVATYDGATINLYLNGVLAFSNPYVGGILNVNTPLLIGKDPFNFYQYHGAMDEVKLYNTTLTPAAITSIYTNELAGKNYDGTLRVCPLCDTNVTAGIWSLVGVPADFRTAAVKDVATVFDEFPIGSYNVPANVDGWVVQKRTYSATDNNSSYTILPYTGTPLVFGEGYWLISKVGRAWSENGLPQVDYNSTNIACVTQPCVEMNLTVPNPNIGNGTGGKRINMLGFVGQKPINWADCRIVVTDVNGTVAYTPSAAAASGYIDSQVWQYNPGLLGSNANGYTTCTDTSPGGCKLEPYKGFWLILFSKTVGTTVQLLLPKG